MVVVVLCDAVRETKKRRSFTDVMIFVALMLPPPHGLDLEREKGIKQTS